LFPRDLNQQEDSLALAASTFKSPIIPQIKYEVEMRHRPSILDNVKHWQVFEDDQQLRRFLELMDEFSSTHIDNEEDIEDDEEVSKDVEIDTHFNNYMENHKVYN
jgi:hypothetical protein